MAEAGERLQKVLAHAGVASRRAAEELIVAGRVSVNGQVVTELGTRVVPGRDMIAVDGEYLAIGASGYPKGEKLVYVMLNKPAGILSAVGDSRGRRTVTDLVGVEARLFPVGRLDLDSEGLVLLTNDGELANQMTHPRYGHEKEYEVLVEGLVSDEALVKWRCGGIVLDGEATAPCRVDRLHTDRGAYQGQGSTRLRVVMHEGRKRQLRRVAMVLGHPVRQIIRTRIGPLKLGRLKAGAWRRLTPAEVDALHAATTPAPGAGRRRPAVRREKRPARK